MCRYVHLRVADICIDFSDDLRAFANFYELFNFMICLPLFIYVDILEFVSSCWVKWDRQMWPSIARNAALLVDLALVRVVLSDKTGTITSGKKVCFVINQLSPMIVLCKTMPSLPCHD